LAYRAELLKNKIKRRQLSALYAKLGSYRNSNIISKILFKCCGNSKLKSL